MWWPAAFWIEPPPWLVSDNPIDAFDATGGNWRSAPGPIMHFYRLAPELEGHEFVVRPASVIGRCRTSAWSPTQKKANGRHEEIAYFRSISDLLASARVRSDGLDGQVQETPGDLGFGSCVLGDGTNRAAFQRTLLVGQKASIAHLHQGCAGQ